LNTIYGSALKTPYKRSELNHAVCVLDALLERLCAGFDVLLSALPTKIHLYGQISAPQFFEVL
jgi:hypothetical protein